MSKFGDLINGVQPVETPVVEETPVVDTAPASVEEPTVDLNQCQKMN